VRRRSLDEVDVVRGERAEHPARLGNRPCLVRVDSDPHFCADGGADRLDDLQVALGVEADLDVHDFEPSRDSGAGILGDIIGIGPHE
jgi:hypothetical protein